MYEHRNLITEIFRIRNSILCKNWRSGYDYKYNYIRGNYSDWIITRTFKFVLQKKVEIKTFSIEGKDLTSVFTIGDEKDIILIFSKENEIKVDYETYALIRDMFKEASNAY
jgi:hypothetical protein